MCIRKKSNINFQNMDKLIARMPGRAGAHMRACAFKVIFCNKHAFRFARNLSYNKHAFTSNTLAPICLCVL